MLAGILQELRRGGAITPLLCTVASGLPAQANIAVCLGSWKLVPVCSWDESRAPCERPGCPAAWEGSPAPCAWEVLLNTTLLLKAG